MKRLLCLLVTLCVLLGMMPTAVTAAAPIHMDQVTHQNPLYDGIVTQLPTPIQPRSAQARDIEYHATTAEAGAVVREAMARREPSVDVGLMIPNFEDQLMYDALYDIFDQAIVHTGTPTHGDYLQWQYASWGGGADGSLQGTTAYLIYTFSFTYYTTADQEAQVDTAIANLRSSLSLTGKSDYEKLTAIYRYICDNITYDNEHLNDQNYTLQYTAYAALINRTAVCQGYALLLYRLALEEGIDCRLIAGTGNGGPHGWNIARLDNLYYNLDSTWDAGETQWQYFLKCENNFGGHVRDAEYKTSAFHQSYPMSTTDYDGAHSHSYTAVTTPATCTADGQIVYTCTCGHSYTETLPSTGHHFGQWTQSQAPSCTADGQQKRTCGNCGLTETQAVTATGHSFSQWTTVTEPTCTQEGMEQRSCSRCHLTEQKALAATGHTMGQWTSTRAATCTQDGEQKRTCSHCDYFETRATAATGHSFGHWNQVEAPTCTEAGSEMRVCSTCSATESRAVSATGHNYRDDICQTCGQQKPGTVVVPAVPQIKSCYSKAQTSVKVTWTTVSGADGYELWRSTNPNDPNSWSRAKSILSGTTDRYTNQGLTVGVTYYYKIRSFVLDKDGERVCSDFSAVDYMPAAVVFDGPYSNATYRIRLRWNEIGGSHGYQIWRLDGDGTWRIVKTLGDKGNTLTNDQGGTTAYSNAGLTAGGQYTYRMRAFRITSDGRKVFGAYSEDITVAVKPNAPTLSVTCPKSGRAKLEWSAVNGAAGYQIWMSTSPNGGFQIIKSITNGATTYTKNDLVPGKTYYFQIRAYAEVEGKKTFSAFSPMTSIQIK